MPKYIKHYINQKNILKTQEKKQREKKMLNYLKVKKKARSITYAKIKSRCLINGRAKAYYSYFGLSRHSLKKIFNKGSLPGITFSSW